MQIGNLTNKVIIVTGGNSGLGFESVKALSAAGATVVMACRNKQRAQSALKEIQSQVPDTTIDLMTLDLASLASIKSFANEFKNKYNRLDVLMNNAGLMAIPQKQTADGFEMQLGTNHLGHFALTGELIETLMQTPASRIVSVTSLAANTGRINFKDLMSKKRYSRWLAYGQSKLANMLFGLELQRRLAAINADTISVLAHPGFSSTNLQAGPAEGGGIAGRLTERMLRPMCQSQSQGALPQLYAATQSDVKGGNYYGPCGAMEMRGEPKRVKLPKAGKNRQDAEQLWTESVSLTGVGFSELYQKEAELVS